MLDFLFAGRNYTYVTTIRAMSSRGPSHARDRAKETFAVDAYRIIKSVFIVSIIEILVASASLHCDFAGFLETSARNNDEWIIFSCTEPQHL